MIKIPESEGNREVANFIKQKTHTHVRCVKDLCAVCLSATNFELSLSFHEMVVPHKYVL